MRNQNHTKMVCFNKNKHFFGTKRHFFEKYTIMGDIHKSNCGL